MFQNRLEDIVKGVEGGEAAILMGFDGIPVDHYEGSSIMDIETVGMEFSVVLKEVRKAAELLETGSTEEMMIRTEKMVTILRIINKTYFLAFALKPDGNTGKARYAMRVLAPELGRDLL